MPKYNFLLSKMSKQINSADLANKVGHVEGGHDEDWEPLPQGVVPYFRLQPGEQTQSDAVGHSYGQHVGPDHTGHNVTMQDHVWSGKTRFSKLKSKDLGWVEGSRAITPGKA